MTRKRHNINIIAEILLEELDKMGKVAKSIESSVNTPIKVDTAKYEQLIKQTLAAHRQMEQNQKAILSDSKEVLKKTKGRVPNWMISFLIGAFLCLLGGVFYTMQQSEKYAYQKLAVEHWKQKYEECASESE